MARTKEMSRFTDNGKTFFLNRGKTKNEDDYLAVNTIYGRGHKERLVTFPSQFIKFIRHYQKAAEEILGVSFNDTPGGHYLPKWQKECPMCGSGNFKIDINEPEWCEWAVVCEECDEIILETEEYDES